MRILQTLPHSGSWLVNARWELEEPAIKISMDFHCQFWPVSLIGITAVLFITGPTRLSGWGGLQNRRGLDLLTAEKRRLYLFLNEECCFYVNQSEIVRDMAQQLREQIIERREKLANSWGNWNNIWSWTSWLLPLTGPLFIFFVVLLFGPCILNPITQFITSQIESIKLQMVIAQYSPLSDGEL